MARYVVVLLLLCSALSCAARVSDVIRDDPNTPGAQASARQDDGDPRLAAKVTYEAKRKPVVDILGDLSELTGVVLKAGWSGKDWQVRDRRMSIFASEVPLVTLMNTIADVMKFKWTIGNVDDVPSYRLYMDRKSAHEYEEMLNKEQEEIREKHREICARALGDIGSAAQLSSVESRDMKESNPYLYAMGASGLADSIPNFLSVCPRAGDAVLDGSGFNTPALALSEEQQSALVRVIRDQWKFDVRKHGFPVAEYSDVIPEEQLTDILANAQVKINRGRDSGGFSNLSDLNLSVIEIEFPGTQLDPRILRLKMRIPLLDPKSSWAKYQGRILSDTLDRPDVSYNDIVKQLNDAKAYPMPGDLMQELNTIVVDVGEERIEHGDDPELDVTLESAIEEKKPATYDDLLWAVAKSTGMLVVSDAFGKVEKCGDIFEQTTAREALQKIQKDLVCNWWRDGSIIELRDRFWVQKRMRQIPDATLKRWRSAVTAPGVIKLNELAEMAMLTQEQFNLNIRGDEKLDVVSITSARLGRQDLLRFYARLDSGKKQRLFSENGLHLAGLSDALRPVAASVIANPRLLDPEDPLGKSCTLRAVAGKSTDDKPRYTFRLSAPGSSSHGCEWVVAF